VVSVATERYVVEHPELNVLVNAGGSGVGVNQLGEGKIDIGNKTRCIIVR
jgi:phosphate transport system substrate-binding protein